MSMKSRTAKLSIVIALIGMVSSWAVFACDCNKDKKKISAKVTTSSNKAKSSN